MHDPVSLLLIVHLECEQIFRGTDLKLGDPFILLDDDSYQSV